MSFDVLDQLPEELLVNVLRLCSSVEDILAASLVCKRWFFFFFFDLSDESFR